MAQREAVFPADRQALYEKHRYSAAVRSGDLLFVSGQVGSRPDGSPEPDFEAQVRLAFANLEATLLAAGCGFDDIVDVTTFYTDPEKQHATAAAVRGEFFKSPPYPSLTGVGVNWLAGFDFEIKVTARIPSRTSASVSRRNPETMWDMASLGWSHVSGGAYPLNGNRRSWLRRQARIEGGLKSRRAEVRLVRLGQPVAAIKPAASIKGAIGSSP
jgi:enamine deaminase RidA (YjgF/YER057c/UK114 family)